MVFSSVTFMFLFLPVVLLAYFLSPRMLRNYILLFFSLLFYAWGEPIYSILMILSIIVAYFTALLIDKYRKEEKHKKAKGVLLIAVVWNLGFLIFFKYTNLIIETVNSLSGIALQTLSLTLPIGISFYSFQTLSYVIDVYRGDVKPQKNLCYLATYVSFFPQLIAGPIVRYQTIEEQLTSRKETVDKFTQGIIRFSIGLGKKVLLANQIGLLFTELTNLPLASQSIIGVWLSVLAFGFQIYFDFSGYSDMAIGLGKMFGFDFLENFQYPYVSKSITEFWHRWHISLSTWFRDYVYIPLGGNRRGKWKHYRNILIVWMLTGIWHGASWNFLMWGLYFGLLLLIEKIFLLKYLCKLPKFMQHLYALIFVFIGWALFASDQTGGFILTLKSMFFMNQLPFINAETIFYARNYLFAILIVIIASTPLPAKIGEKLQGLFQNKFEVFFVSLFVLLLLIFATAALVSESFNPFLYFRF